MTPEKLLAAFDAIPAAIDEVGGWTARQLFEQSDRHAHTISSSGMAYWSSGRFDLSDEDLAEALTYGLAILARRAEGVTAFGRHWCSRKHWECPGPGLLHLPEIVGVGAVYTPPDLATEVVTHTLNTLVYRPGPMQTADETQWRIRSGRVIEDLKICDPAVGAGAMLVAACRYLSARLLEAWAAEQLPGSPGDPDKATPYDPASGHLVLTARAMVLRCLYGVDLDPRAIDLATIACSLLVPTHPGPKLNLKAGDSLLGISSLDQLRWMHVHPERGRTLHDGVQPIDTAAIRTALRTLAHQRDDRRTALRPAAFVAPARRVFEHAHLADGPLATVCDMPTTDPDELWQTVPAELAAQATCPTCRKEVTR